MVKEAQKVGFIRISRSPRSPRSPRPPRPPRAPTSSSGPPCSWSPEARGPAWPRCSSRSQPLPGVTILYFPMESIQYFCLTTGFVVPSLQGGFLNFPSLNLAQSQSLYKIPYTNFYSPTLLLQGFFLYWTSVHVKKF